MKIFTKIIGITVIIAAIAGLIICIGGIVGVWMVREPLAAGLTNTFELLSTTLRRFLGRHHRGAVELMSCFTN